MAHHKICPAFFQAGSPVGQSAYPAIISLDVGGNESAVERWRFSNITNCHNSLPFTANGTMPTTFCAQLMGWTAPALRSHAHASASVVALRPARAVQIPEAIASPCRQDLLAARGGQHQYGFRKTTVNGSGERFIVATHKEIATGYAIRATLICRPLPLVTIVTHKNTAYAVQQRHLAETKPLALPVGRWQKHSSVVLPDAPRGCSARERRSWDYLQ